MGQVKSGLGQNGPNFLAVIVPKWADFVSFLDQNGEVKIIMSLILHLDTGKIQNTYYEQPLLFTCLVRGTCLYRGTKLRD